jgi:hypothetical protein
LEKKKQGAMRGTSGISGECGSPGGSIGNLSEFYSYRLIGKLIAAKFEKTNCAGGRPKKKEKKVVNKPSLK